MFKKRNLSFRRKLIMAAIAGALAVASALSFGLKQKEQRLETEEHSTVQKIHEMRSSVEAQPKEKQPKIKAAIVLLQNKVKKTKEIAKTLKQEDDDVQRLNALLDGTETMLHRWPDLILYVEQEINSANDGGLDCDKRLKKADRQPGTISTEYLDILSKIMAAGVRMHRMKGSIGGMMEQLSEKLENLTTLRRRLIAAKDPSLKEFLRNVQLVIDEGKLLLEDLEHSHDSTEEILSWLTRLHHHCREHL